MRESREIEVLIGNVGVIASSVELDNIAEVEAVHLECRMFDTMGWTGEQKRGYFIIPRQQTRATFCDESHQMFNAIEVEVRREKSERRGNGDEVLGGSLSKIKAMGGLPVNPSD